MNRLGGIALIFLIGVFLLPACSGQQPPNTLQPISTPSAVHASPAPQNTTVTPSPTNTRLVTTSIPFAFETPTPLPTPSDQSIAYELKFWDEQSAFDLVSLAEQFSYADNIPMPFGEKRFNYQAHQSAIKLASQEALLRFPDTFHKEKLDWRIALANTILSNSDSDEWILNKIENALNNGDITPDNINKLLNDYAFEVGDQQLAQNLFGDGRLAQVYWIVQQDRGYTGLYAALRQDENRSYKLTKIYSSWDFNFGYDESMRIEDHTGDGIPEVLLFPGYHNGSFCGYELMIYHWMEDQFIDASKGQFSFDQCSYPETWEYGSLDNKRMESIETWRSVSLYPAVVKYEQFVWNGKWYELSESHLIPPEIFNISAAKWITYAMNAGEYQTIIEKTQQFLSNEAQLKTMEAELGPSYPDYLRFQLGLAYAFESDTLQAHSILEDLKQNPINPSINTLSRASQVYLENYSGDVDLYRACQAALKVVMESFSDQPPDRFTNDFEQYVLSSLGYLPSSPLDSVAICNLNVAFKTIIANTDIEEHVNLPEQLRNSGVSIRSALAIDINGNGRDEWILLIDTPGDDAPVNLWVLFKTSNSIMPIPVVSWERKQFDLPKIRAESLDINVETAVTPDGITTTFLQVGGYLYIFEFNIAEQYLDHKLWVVDSVENYIIRQDNNFQLEITTNNEYCELCKETYIWSSGSFISTNFISPRLSEAEAALFLNANPNEARSQLQEALIGASDHDIPHLMYLLGLAFELAGEDSNAIQTYWKLWHDYPQTIYARLAQAKLETRK